MEEEIFLASDKDKVVKALGIKVNCNLNDLKIFINGVDVSKQFVLEEVRIVQEKKVT